MKVYHQAGHNSNWNRDSFLKYGKGDGIILSPVHMISANITALDSELKQSCIFDPQFYVPGSQKAKFQSYDFFPETLLDGFSTNDFEASAHESAEKCLHFQVQNNFELLLIPSRYQSDMISNYIEKQKAFSVDPFLNEIERIQTDKRVFLTVCLTSPMLSDHKFRSNILNWVTSYPSLHGIYLLVDLDESTKQVFNYQKLLDQIEFIKEIQSTGLEVLSGYANTEGLLFQPLDIFGITMGAYENTRRFSIDKFLESDEEQRGPAPRLYMPKLLNWVRYSSLLEIREDHPELWGKIYVETEFSESVFTSGKTPHFTKPDLYHHHFNLIFEQYSALNGIGTKKDRVSYLREMIKSAASLYQDIDTAGILLSDDNCRGVHLPIWNRLLSKI
jgi:hypothetical protein